MVDLVTAKPDPLVSVKRTRADLDAPPPFVSFTMPAYNEEANVERTVGECAEAFKKAGIAGGRRLQGMVS